MKARVVVSVSDKYLWALEPFAYLFNKYWSPSEKVVVAGYTKPDFVLPENFTFYSIATPQYPKDKWVNGFCDFLNVFNSEHFVLMLEDYWISRIVDIDGIGILFEFMKENPGCLRMDLTGDRLYAGGMCDIGYYNRFDIIEAKGSPYQMSLQAGIWNKKLLLDILESLPESLHSAWDVEIEGTNILASRSYRVFGTRQWPIRYVNGMNNAKTSQINLSGFTQDDLNVLSMMIRR